MGTMTKNAAGTFSNDCRTCPRLSGYLDAMRKKYPDYYTRPVPSFGVERPRLLIVGLAPGLHGANRTGRPFTGDHAGLLLYRSLYLYGFASAGESTSGDDDLQLIECRITNAVRCVPPENKPTTQEVKFCNIYLREEIDQLGAGTAILALGGVAHAAILRALELRPVDYRFAHAARHQLPGDLSLYDSYHCSRYNTQTRRLTEPMFHSVFDTIRTFLDSGSERAKRPPASL
jgi:uracil-DNA glycosylase family 4